MEDAQFLFVPEQLPRNVPDAREIRERLNAMLGKMRAAASWPWKSAAVSDYRERVWPSLLARLPDAGEAELLRHEFEEEAARLDDAATFALG